MDGGTVCGDCRLQRNSRGALRHDRRPPTPGVRRMVGVGEEWLPWSCRVGVPSRLQRNWPGRSKGTPAPCPRGDIGCPLLSRAGRVDHDCRAWKVRSQNRRRRVGFSAPPARRWLGRSVSLDDESFARACGRLERRKVLGSNVRDRYARRPRSAGCDETACWRRRVNAAPCGIRPRGRFRCGWDASGRARSCGEGSRCGCRRRARRRRRACARGAP